MEVRIQVPLLVGKKGWVRFGLFTSLLTGVVLPFLALISDCACYKKMDFKPRSFSNFTPDSNETTMCPYNAQNGRHS